MDWCFTASRDDKSRSYPLWEQIQNNSTWLSSQHLNSLKLEHILIKLTTTDENGQGCPETFYFNQMPILHRFRFFFVILHNPIYFCVLTSNDIHLIKLKKYKSID